MKPSRRILIFLAALLITALACSTITGENNPAPPENENTANNTGAAPETNQNADIEIPDGLEPFPEGDPLNLIVTLEEGNSVSAEIGPEGGELSVTAANGTTFHLSIPEGALFTPEEITMTPAETITGFEQDNVQTDMVDLQPDGLYFTAPATLTITYTDTPDPDEIAGFLTNGSGEDFHMVPGELNGNQLTLQLTHFSQPGTARAAKIVLQEIRASYTPTTAENQTTNWFAVELPFMDADDLQRHLDRWFYHSVLVRAKNSTNNDSFIELAVGEYLAWKDMILIVAPDNDFFSRFDDEILLFQEELGKALVNAFDRASKKCFNESDPEQALRMFRWGLIAESLDIWGKGGFTREFATPILKACFNFQFEFRSKVEADTEQEDATAQVFAPIPLDVSVFDPTLGIIKNSGPVNYELFEVRNTASPCTFSTTPGKMIVNFVMRFNIQYPQPKIESVLLSFGFPESPSETMHCNIGTQNLQFWLPMYSIAMQGFRTDYLFQIELPIYENDPEKGYAYQELHGPLEGNPEIRETSTYHLIHTPNAIP